MLLYYLYHLHYLYLFIIYPINQSFSLSTLSIYLCFFISHYLYFHLTIPIHLSIFPLFHYLSIHQTIHVYLSILCCLFPVILFSIFPLIPLLLFPFILLSSATDTHAGRERDKIPIFIFNCCALIPSFGRVANAGAGQMGYSCYTAAVFLNNATLGFIRGGLACPCVLCVYLCVCVEGGGGK